MTSSMPVPGSQWFEIEIEIRKFKMILKICFCISKNLNKKLPSL